MPWLESEWLQETKCFEREKEGRREPQFISYSSDYLQGTQWLAALHGGGPALIP